MFYLGSFSPSSCIRSFYRHRSRCYHQPFLSYPLYIYKQTVRGNTLLTEYHKHSHLHVNNFEWLLGLWPVVKCQGITCIIHVHITYKHKNLNRTTCFIIHWVSDIYSAMIKPKCWQKVPDENLRCFRSWGPLNWEMCKHNHWESITMFVSGKAPLLSSSKGPSLLLAWLAARNWAAVMTAFPTREGTTLNITAVPEVS